MMKTNAVDGFKFTTSIKKLRKLTKRIRIVPGGTSAGKTFGILPILIDTAIKNPKLEISVVSESVPHLRKGALKDFLKILKATGRYIDSNYNRTFLTYTFSNGSYIEFFSADQEDKVRGPRRNILYINECNNISFETYHQLAIRTDKVIWLDYNPATEFWVNTEFGDDNDVEILTLTYKDNEALSDSIVTEIEKAKHKAFFNADFVNDEELFLKSNIKNSYWSNWWKVYGLGKIGNLDGVIFNNWKVIDSVPEYARYIGSGIDFGYTNDPTTCVNAYRFNDQIIWDESIYQSGLKNSDIASILKQQGRISSDYITADSAEPKSIDEINAYGFSIVGVDKGADSIKYGISIMQEEPFFVTKRSVNLIKELRNYCWDTDKQGNKLNRPIDAYNHAIDAMRYLSMMKLANRKYIDPVHP